MNKVRAYIESPVHIAPLATFRAIFGAMMFIAVVRFMLKGWVDELYIRPVFYFKYYGFGWVEPLGETGMYTVFVLLAFSAILISIGLYYRLAITSFFLLFTYVELLDQSNYLNHYYFISIVSFLLILVPANRYFSIDVLRKPSIRTEKVARWNIGIFKLQLGLVYFFAGVAKINHDWLIKAMPLKIWLPANSSLPVIGGLLKLKWVAYMFSWAGMLYDLFIPFFLLWRKSRGIAYIAVIAFHVVTWFLLPIGMFPFIMILGTLIFFPASFHEKLIHHFKKVVRIPSKPVRQQADHSPGMLSKIALGIVTIHFVLQIFLPIRNILYPGNLFWTEEGFRFSWRVMLMEKAGYAIFHVNDPESGKETIVDNSLYLTRNQERMMSTQPDMILQFAGFLKEKYMEKGLIDPEVNAEVYVSLNGSGSRLFIDPKCDLTKINEGFAHKNWILPFESSANENWLSKND